MFGLFSMLSTGISTIYPIFATYKSFEKYQTSANIVSSGNVNIGGIQVPLVSILKRASGDSLDPSISHQEELLQFHLLNTQKWLVYWIVYAVFNTLESVLFLKHALPFYSLWKVVLFSWMVSPIFLSTIANASALSPNDLSAARLNRDWLEFSESGCGLCYYYYIKPWLDGEFEFFSKFDSLLLLDKLLIISPYFGSIKKFKFFNSQGNDENPFNYSSNSTQNGISNLASKIYDQGSYIFINQFFNSEQPQSQPQHQPLTNEFKREKDVNVGPTVSNETDEEFDFVDKPKVDDVTNRKGKVEGKKGWIW